MFYTFNQNNSGGRFTYTPTAGISHYVVIEADSADEANCRALDVGIYFDPYYSIDCPCCGSRWSEVDDPYDASEVPSVYGTEIVPGDSYAKIDGKSGWKWIEGDEAFIHYANGDILGAWH